MIAVFQDRNKQYRVREGDQITLDRSVELEGLGEDSDVTFDKVMYVGAEDGGEARIGAPFVDGAKVTAKVHGHHRGEKIVVGKFRRRKNYRRKKGHRQGYTRVEITGISG